MVIPARTAAAKTQAVVLTSAVVVCGATSTGAREIATARAEAAVSG